MKWLLMLSLFICDVSHAAKPSNPCASGETKLIYSSSISFGGRIQIENPQLCAGRKAYSILVFHHSYQNSDYSQSLCLLYQLGRTVDHEARFISKERLAVFDSKGNFGGLNTYISYTSMGYGSSSHYYAATSLTCEL
jgi:hypothetical protein